MRIGLLCLSGNEANSFTGVWEKNLPSALARQGVEITQVASPLAGRVSEVELTSYLDNLDVSRFDHVVSMGLRYFTTTPREPSERLRNRVAGALCQIYDGGLLDKPPVDLTFTFRDDSERYPPDSEANRHFRHHQYNKYIGWAADSELLQPKQSLETLQILVDHPAFAEGRDESLTVLFALRRLVNSKIWSPRFKSVAVSQILDGGVQPVDLTTLTVREYKRSAIPHAAICEYYCQSHIFMVTHRESLGLTVLETAMAGALPVVPRGMIVKDRLSTVRHYETEWPIDWTKVMEMVDPETNASIARPNSWDAVAERMIGHLRSFSGKRPPMSVPE